MGRVNWRPGNMLYPLPAVMVSVADKDGKPNIFTVAWTGTVCSNPPMVSISVRPERYSYHCIEETGEFVINLTTKELTKAADFCGVRSGRDVDKFAEMNLTPWPGQKVSVPQIAESPVSLECRVTQKIELGSHTMFVAEVVSVSVDEKWMDETGRFHLEKADPIVYSHGTYYGLGEAIGTFGYSVAKKKKKKKQHRVFWFFIKLQIFLMVLILGGLCFYYFGGYADKVAKLHSEAVELLQKSDKNTFLPARTSTLYDTNGDEISETATTKKADYVKYEDIPQNFVNCMVSIEDKKFYKHNGVDLKAIVRAAKSIIKNKRITQGGSTITMQLARNIYLDTNKNWQRKVKEMFIAMALEKKYSKNDIMEFYLNNVYFMNGYYGIQAACHGYFNCELSDLDLSQTAFLCAIPNSPTSPARLASSRPG